MSVAHFMSMQLVPLLRHANDDTRAAAAAAFGHICRRMSAQDVGGEVDYPTALNDLDLNAVSQRRSHEWCRYADARCACSL